MDKTSKGKKNGKAKNKSEHPKQDSPKPPPEEGAKRKPKYPCLICDEDHYTKDYPRQSEVSRLLKDAPGTPAVLKEPFPSQQTQMVADPSQPSSSLGSQVFIAGTIPVHISTRAKEYLSHARKEPEVPSSAPLSSSGPLHIERPSTKTPIRPRPKGVLWKSSYNPNAHAAQHYSIVEDLAQAPSAMSTLKVLQSCPSQRKSLLSAIGGIDPADSDLITFDLEGHTPRLPQQISFIIQVIINAKTIHRIVIDEGASTCIMSVACWKAIGSPTLSQSPTTLEAFDGRESRPFGILQRLPISLEGETVKVEVEVVDANLTYNLLLGRSWTYAMQAVASSLFHVICFPHQGKIVIVD